MVDFTKTFEQKGSVLGDFDALIIVHDYVLLRVVLHGALEPHDFMHVHFADGLALKRLKSVQLEKPLLKLRIFRHFCSQLNVPLHTFFDAVRNGTRQIVVEVARQEHCRRVIFQVVELVLRKYTLGVNLGFLSHDPGLNNLERLDQMPGDTGLCQTNNRQDYSL